jgi:hypothetical protein
VLLPRVRKPHLLDVTAAARLPCCCGRYVARLRVLGNCWVTCSFTEHVHTRRFGVDYEVPHCYVPMRRDTPYLHVVYLAVSLAWVWCCVCAVPDACANAGARPVLLIPGFLGAPLYDSSRKYDIEWPDFDAFGTPYGPGATDLDLPMRWSGLDQAKGPVGPERNAEDVLPSLDGLFGDLFEFTVRPERHYKPFSRLPSCAQTDRGTCRRWTL